MWPCGYSAYTYSYIVITHMISAPGGASLSKRYSNIIEHWHRVGPICWVTDRVKKPWLLICLRTDAVDDIVIISESSSSSSSFSVQQDREMGGESGTILNRIQDDNISSGSHCARAIFHRIWHYCYYCSNSSRYLVERDRDYRYFTRLDGIRYNLQ